MTNQKTVFHVCVTSGGWCHPASLENAEQVDGGFDHVTVREAEEWDYQEVQRPLYEAGRSWIWTRVLATEDGGRTYRDISWRDDLG